MNLKCYCCAFHSMLNSFHLTNWSEISSGKRTFFHSPYALGAQQYCNKWTNKLHFGRPDFECWLSYPELCKHQFSDLDEGELIPALACTQAKQLMPGTRQMMVQAQLGCGSCRLCISPSLFFLGSLGWHSCHSTCVENAWKDDEGGPLNCLPPGGPWRLRGVWSGLSISPYLLQLVSTPSSASQAQLRALDLSLKTSLLPNPGFWCPTQLPWQQAPGWQKRLLGLVSSCSRWCRFSD